MLRPQRDSSKTPPSIQSRQGIGRAKPVALPHRFRPVFSRNLGGFVVTLGILYCVPGADSAGVKPSFPSNEGLAGGISLSQTPRKELTVEENEASSSIDEPLPRNPPKFTRYPTGRTTFSAHPPQRRLIRVEPQIKLQLIVVALHAAAEAVELLIVLVLLQVGQFMDHNHMEKLRRSPLEQRGDENFTPGFPGVFPCTRETKL